MSLRLGKLNNATNYVFLKTNGVVLDENDHFAIAVRQVAADVRAKCNSSALQLLYFDLGAVEKDADGCLKETISKTI